jgi:DNA-binding protein HU-beta
VAKKKAKVVKKAAKAKKIVKAPKKAAKPAKKAAPKAAKAAPAEKKAPVPVPPKKLSLTAPKNSGSKQYTQSELYENIKGSCGFHTRSEAKLFYGGFVDLIQAALKGGYKVVLPGLGKIQVRKTKARNGINPATREPIKIPAKRKVAFTALKALKEAVL